MVKKSTPSLSKEIEKEIPSGRRLEFFTDFLAAMHETAADVARALEVTRAAVGHWIKADDCRLSYCEDYINRKGYELSFELIKKSTKKSEKVMINIETREATPEDSVCRRLLFLHSALSKMGVSRVQLAKDLGLTYNTVRHWFVEDNIYVSHIFNIADLYGLQVCISIKPKD